MIKPMLASDFEESKLKFPLTAQPKLDGVRAVNLDGNLTGRSLKAHKNKFVTSKFSVPHFQGLDGEMTLGNVAGAELCRDTSSALSTIVGEPDVMWNVFDLILPHTIDLPYSRRYSELRRYVDRLGHRSVKLMPGHLCTNLDQLLELEDHWLNLGYEGAIIRDPDGKYKQGRSTVKEGGLLRIKRFMEEDAEVLEVVEGNTNGNEAKTNELGRTERSSHQENMTPNGMVGNLTCMLLKDVKDTQSGELLLKAGQVITVSAGNMPHSDRVRYLKDEHLIVGQVIKFKFFPKGIKDKPRFPTFVSIRSESDKA